MIRPTTVTLLSALPQAHGVYEAPAIEGREVFADVQSVTRREAYEALSHGMHPEYILVLGDYSEYRDELYCVLEGRRYKILRAYVRADRRIELTIERVREHAL